MLNTSMNPWPYHDDDEIQAAINCLTSGKVNQWTGNEVTSFEKEFATYVGTPYAVAVTNGTVALDLIFQTMMRWDQLQPGDEVIVTSRTFLASASSIVNADLKPVFADVDLNSGNIAVETIDKVFTDKTKAILCVHLAGWPCDMPAICNYANGRGLYVIEDCAQAHGASIDGQKVGSFGQAAAWSFCQDKIMSTAGEGGMITTHDPCLWSSIWSFKDHGKNYEKTMDKEYPHPPGFRWVHDAFGSNYRMTEIQAAIGRVQLRKLDTWVAQRNGIANQIDYTAEGYSAVRTTKAPSNYRHAKYKHYLYVNPDGLNDGWDRDRIIKELNELGVPCYQGSCSEVYLEDAFRNHDVDFSPHGRLPNAKQLGESSLMFLVHPTLGGKNVYELLAGLEKVLMRASKTKCKM